MILSCVHSCTMHVWLPKWHMSVQIQDTCCGTKNTFSLKGGSLSTMVADVTTTQSFMERRMLQELQGTGHNMFSADQDSKAAHVLSSALAYIRSLAASALETDPYDLPWKQTALVFNKAHQDMILLSGLLLDKAVCTGGWSRSSHCAALGRTW